MYFRMCVFTVDHGKEGYLTISHRSISSTRVSCKNVAPNPSPLVYLPFTLEGACCLQLMNYFIYPIIDTIFVGSSKIELTKYILNKFARCYHLLTLNSSSK